MNAPLSGSDDEIKGLLAGADEDVAAALNWVDQIYRYKICGLVRVCFPGMPCEDLPEVWQETLVSLYSMAGDGRFDRNGSLQALLRTLAIRRAQDRMRRNAAWHHPIDALMKGMQEPQLVEKWQALNALQRSEVVELICESVERLPPRQNLVWRTFVAHYPDSERMDYLTEQVRTALAGQSHPESTDEGAASLSKKAVSSALNAGRVRIREDLKRKGYDL